KVKEKLSSVSRALDLKALVEDATVCGMSSSLVQVTIVPAFTVSFSGPNVKLAILTLVSAAAHARPAATQAPRTKAAPAARGYPGPPRTISSFIAASLSPAKACQ